MRLHRSTDVSRRHFWLKRDLLTTVAGHTCEAGTKRSSPPTPLPIMPRKRGMMGFFCVPGSLYRKRGASLLYLGHCTVEASRLRNTWSFFLGRWSRSSLAVVACRRKIRAQSHEWLSGNESAPNQRSGSPQFSDFSVFLMRRFDDVVLLLLVAGTDVFVSAFDFNSARGNALTCSTVSALEF